MKRLDMEDFNAKLTAWDRKTPDGRAGMGGYETYDVISNVPRQSRSRVPTAYENALAGALEGAYLDGAKSLEDLAAGLNEKNVLRSDGQAWTADLLAAELETLGR
jgi:hypothetical protein